MLFQELVSLSRRLFSKLTTFCDSVDKIDYSKLIAEFVSWLNKLGSLNCDC